MGEGVAPGVLELRSVILMFDGAGAPEPKGSHGDRVHAQDAHGATALHDYPGFN